jgi:ABC-type phosphate transport system permease subunit
VVGLNRDHHIDDVVDVHAETCSRASWVRRSRGDNVFFSGASFSGAVVLAIMVGIGLFLAPEAVRSLRVVGLWSFSRPPNGTDRGRFGIWRCCWGP